MKTENIKVLHKYEYDIFIIESKIMVLFASCQEWENQYFLWPKHVTSYVL